MNNVSILAAIVASGITLTPFDLLQAKQSKGQPYGVNSRKGRSGKYTPPMVKMKKQKRKHTKPASQRGRKKP